MIKWAKIEGPTTIKKIWHAANSVFVFIPYGIVTFLTYSIKHLFGTDITCQRPLPSKSLASHVWYLLVPSGIQSLYRKLVKSPWFFCFPPSYHRALKGGSTGAVVLTQDTTQNPSMDLIQLFLENAHGWESPEKIRKMELLMGKS